MKPVEDIMDDRVERVARAIAAMDNEEGYDAWQEGNERACRCYREYAKAAIAALQPPDGVTEALDEAMRRYPNDRAGLAWFAAASGLKAGGTTQEDRGWAKSRSAEPKLMKGE